MIEETFDRRRIRPFLGVFATGRLLINIGPIVGSGLDIYFGRYKDSSLDLFPFLLSSDFNSSPARQIESHRLRAALITALLSSFLPIAR